MRLDFASDHGAGLPAERWSVAGETDRLTDVLLCGPDHLEPVPCCSVTQESRRKGHRTCRDTARTQHDALQEALERHGVRCHALPPAPDMPDLCFTRDQAVMTPWGLLGLRPALEHRRRETDHLLAFARSRGIAVAGRVDEGTAEGGDICVARPGLAIIGHSGERTNAAGAEAVADLFRRRGWRAISYAFDPHFLHLDTQFCMVDHDLALACVDVLDDLFLDQLQAEGIELIPVSYKESRVLGCNILSLGDKRILSSAANARVNALLAERGFRVEALEIDQFTRCGGGVHCLTLPLAREASVRAFPRSAPVDLTRHWPAELPTSRAAHG